MQQPCVHTIITCLTCQSIITNSETFAIYNTTSMYTIWHSVEHKKSLLINMFQQYNAIALEVFSAGQKTSATTSLSWPTSTIHQSRLLSSLCSSGLSHLTAFMVTILRDETTVVRHGVAWAVPCSCAVAPASAVAIFPALSVSVAVSSASNQFAFAVDYGC